MLGLAAGYEFDVDRGPDWLWIRIRKAASANSAASLADELRELVEKHFVYRVVLELERLPTLSSSVVLSSRLIDELIQVSQYIHAHDGVLRICGLSPENRDMLNASALDDLCLDYHTRDEAIWGCCDPHLPR